MVIAALRFVSTVNCNTFKHIKYRYYSIKFAKKIEDNGVYRIRNIGVLAHIDAGKTTTTERMLFFAGTIRTMGEVHHGNTVTDFMDEERLRGITIASVTVTFPWKDHRFNLVDTPGHIDFTMEVEQSLSVIDGAIIILDGSAGVEAQTLTVWKQADRYSIPRIVYCNKMDRKDADLQLCLDTLRSKLRVQPIAIQLPIYDTTKTLIGLVNLLTMEKFTWSAKEQGIKYSKEKLDGTLLETALKARHVLVEELSNLDDELAEQIIQEESFDGLSGDNLIASLRRVTLSKLGVPVLCGSSYRNLGVQLLMDAVVQFLPSPEKRSELLTKCFQNSLCARAFKVVHNDQKKILTFLRIYSGKILKGQKIYNVTQQKTEQTIKLMIPYADEHEEVAEVVTGNIAVISGLKHTMSGDLITTNSSVAKTAQERLIAQNLAVEDGFGFSPKVPVPVFLCSIEPTSQAYQLQLEQALIELQREDPSLRVSNSPDTGQTILSGMGELHLEIIKNRIVSEYKLDVDLGPLQIAYRESLLNRVKDTLEMSHTIGSTKHNVRVTLSARPRGIEEEDEAFLLDPNPESAEHFARMIPRHLQAVKQGVSTALARGPKLNCPVIDVFIMLHWLEVGRGTSDTIISATVSQCLRKLFSTAGTCVLEPVMQMEVVTSEDKLSMVLADLSRRRAVIQNISGRSDTKVLFALTPLSELLGYSTDLRTITSGEASFSMEFHGYQQLDSHEETNVIMRVVGFLPT